MESPANLIHDAIQGIGSDALSRQVVSGETKYRLLFEHQLSTLVRLGAGAVPHLVKALHDKDLVRSQYCARALGLLAQSGVEVALDTADIGALLRIVGRSERSTWLYFTGQLLMNVRGTTLTSAVQAAQNGKPQGVMRSASQRLLNWHPCQECGCAEISCVCQPAGDCDDLRWRFVHSCGCSAGVNASQQGSANLTLVCPLCGRSTNTIGSAATRVNED